MFYLANLILSMGIQRLSIFLDSLINYYDYSYNYASYSTNTLFWGLLLIAIGLLIIIKRWNKKHSHNIVGRIVGILLILAAVGPLINNDFEISDYIITTVIGRVGIILSYLIPGILILIYNKKLLEQNKFVNNETPTSEINSSENLINNGSDIDRLRAKLFEASKTNYAQQNLEFYNNLAHSSDILDEIQLKSFKIDNNFLEEIARLTDYYLDIEDNKFQTNQSKETLQKIVDTFGTVDEALENIYDVNFSQESYDIESDIITMKTKLNLEGNLDSPFEKFKSKSEK